jgi:hypothetical protein
MKKLIVNADDLGLTPGVTRGIIDAHLQGIVTSTSAMMNSPCITESLAAVNHDVPELGVGVHLVLSWGRPLLPPKDVPALVDDRGNFFKFDQFAGRLSALNLDEVRAEWQAQIEAFITNGRKPDHLDSHHHSSYMSPGLFRVMLELAQKYDLPIRLPSKPAGDSPAIEAFVQVLGQHPVRYPQSCITAFYDERASLASLSEIIATLPEGISELMCHPGYADRGLMEGSTYTTAREKELGILTSPEIKKMLELHQIQLANFSVLF